jgi:SAM-dependent methyltransferase
MKEKFFEGKDFRYGKFKALMPEYYPTKYKKYIQQECIFLKQKLRGSERVLEAGVGIGRLIPKLSPLVEEFIGVDNATLMLRKSRELSKKYKNTIIIKSELETLDKIFPHNHFDYSICVWNTLGNVDDEVKVLKILKTITKYSIIVTVYKKGSIKERKKWYESVGVKIRKIDRKNEVFYSESGLKSKSYNLQDIRNIAKKSGLLIKEYKKLSEVMLWIELVK